MKKYLTILALLTTLLASGCLELSNSSGSDDVNSEFYGTWEYSCTSGLSGTFIISSESLIDNTIAYENADCTGEVITSNNRHWNLIYGDKIITDSGVEATKIDVSTESEGESRLILDLIYRNDDQLYLGNRVNLETRPTDLDFERQFTLK